MRLPVIRKTGRHPAIRRESSPEGINASPRYPKNWKTSGDPAREFTMIQSAPLMLLADPDEFVSVQLA
ncbi:major capsid protein [Escherichia coli]|uniref:major capsid protein n=1 Tax=Escherichia coli TaxID=562 RepID=UPI003D9A710F